MDYNKTDILCTKHRLWKKKALVVKLIDHLIDNGYEFKEVVLGEPNNFVFADHYEELDDLFSKRGFYGIRIKLTYQDATLEINSNTDGINNVQYTIFAPSEELFEHIQTDLSSIRDIIGPTSDTLASFTEYLQQHPKLVYTVILILVGIALYYLGIHVFLFNLVRILLSFSPFLVMYILFMVLRRRR